MLLQSINQPQSTTISHNQPQSTLYALLHCQSFVWSKKIVDNESCSTTINLSLLYYTRQHKQQQRTDTMLRQGQEQITQIGMTMTMTTNNNKPKIISNDFHSLTKSWLWREPPSINISKTLWKSETI